jgi:putative two-component system response regulator
LTVAQLLIVDDEANFRRALRRTLERAGHRVLEASNVEAAREVLAAQPIELVLCDVNMPGGSGLELIRAVVAETPGTAIVMLTGVDEPAVADEALAVGAHGYMVKPVGRNEARILVATSLRHRELELARRQYVVELESKIFSRTAALREALDQLEATQATVRDAERDAVDRLVTALTIRSEETGAHIRRVGRFCTVLARLAGVGLWTEDEIYLAAMLHDVGKIGIPDSILLKPGPLDAQEREIIERHSDLGNRMLADGRSPVLVLGAQIALSHHERWDGTGYPNGLAHDDIPIAGRIAAIGDVFDALTSNRVYRRALSFPEASAQMRAESGRQFDPELLDLFLSAAEQLEAIRAAHPDPH